MKILYIALIMTALLVPSVSAALYAPWNWTAFPEANMTQIGNYTSMFEYGNTVTDNYFIPFAIFIIFGIVFMSVRVRDMRKSLLIAAHISFVMALGFWVIDLLEERFLVLFGLMALGMTLYMAFQKLRGGN